MQAKNHTTRSELPRDEADSGEFRWDWITFAVALVVAVILVFFTYDFWLSLLPHR